MKKVQALKREVVCTVHVADRAKLFFTKSMHL